MGAWYQFVCEACAYEAEVSGGEDFGFRAFTTTVSCEGCEKLYDVQLAKMPPFPGDADFAPGEPLCPRDAEHRVRKWRRGDPCPRCGGAMVEGGMRALWD
jgi:hypothetical protein